MDTIDQQRKQRENEGERKYGPIDPVNDPRCFKKEMVNELLDSLNYCQYAMEKGEISLCEWFLLDKDLRTVIKTLEIVRRR